MEFLLYLSIIPALGLTAQWLAWRMNLPSILLLLLFGVVLGQFINPDDYLAGLTGGDASAGPELLFPLVSLSVAVIMFEGGLSLKLGELRDAGTATLRLCTAGALITLAGAACAAHYLLAFSWQVSILLGAILVVTGPTVIGPLLRQVRPSRRVAATLKWEGILIDPIGAILAVLVFEHVIGGGVEEAFSPAAILMLAKTAVLGTGLGILGGFALTQAFRRFWVPDHLHGVSALSVGLLLFAISNHFAHESGLITVTVLGLWLTNQHHFDIEHIIEFKENLRTLLIGCLFVVLGSRVDLADVTAVGWPGVAFVLVLIAIVRPVSVFVSLIGSPLNWREKTFIAGLAPRGIVAAAVSSVFALELDRGVSTVSIPGADQLATVTFLVIVGTVAVYGIAAAPLAKWLQLADQKSNGALIVGAESWVRDFALELKRAGLPVLLVDTNYNKIAQAKIAGLEGVCGNILNETLRGELPLAGIGKVLAMTPNDEVNSLAIRECRSAFGRAGAYQLTFNAKNAHTRRGITKHLMGRELFGEGLTFSKLREMHHLGATFKTTKLADEFTYQDFVQKYQNSHVLLGVLKDEGAFELNTVADPLKPIAGQSVIALVSSVAVPNDHDAAPEKPAKQQKTDPTA
ncbi:K(+)/H(+) antiporter NhaP2 [Rubripirellula lacrimiformis]|uniref:K(+)/H(+) antiporter NhaP2 n=1 Tax=Rubripirellula lacrimiformis TaxID=1930273 RepID=A0A517NHF1_9BACT|nr:sodium:proton antiporter [Rubripirellula lacrimiformis]QDT06473.1 K(+)/H(+) antiporter NhaP2 [Rubripirellula lacrimiformis]